TSRRPRSMKLYSALTDTFCVSLTSAPPPTIQPQRNCLPVHRAVKSGFELHGFGPGVHVPVAVAVNLSSANPPPPFTKSRTFPFVPVTTPRRSAIVPRSRTRVRSPVRSDNPSLPWQVPPQPCCTLALRLLLLLPRRFEKLNWPSMPKTAMPLCT